MPEARRAGPQARQGPFGTASGHAWLDVHCVPLNKRGEESMSIPSDTAQIRLQGAIYVAASDRRDNCGGCCYSDRGRNGSDYWCRMHAAPVSKGSCCALQEQPKARKMVPA